MKKSLWTYGVLLGIYIVCLLYLKLTLREMDVMYLYFALMIGVPFFFGYLLLIIARYRYSRDGLLAVWMILLFLGALCITLLSMF